MRLGFRVSDEERARFGRAAMAESSKELLDQPSKPSVLETLLVTTTTTTNNHPARRTARESKASAAANYSKGKPLTAAVPPSQFLDKVKGFLGAIAEANQKLERDVREGSRADYDVEVLTGNEKECIEMDLLLGVADLHTDEAVAAAEATVGGFRPAGRTISGTSSDTGDDDSDEDGDDSGELNAENDGSLRKNKRPKIVVLDPSSD